MISLAQLVARGTAVLYSSMVQSFDMKTAMVASGSPETAILQCGAAQLCQHYHIPSYVIPGWTESKVSDAQAGHENTLGLLTSAMAGANVVSGAGMLETGLTFSPGHLVICNEIAAMTRKFIEGIAVSDETLLVDAVDEVGIGKAYLSHESTRTYARSGSQPKLLDRRPYADWQADGAADLASRANAEATRLIAEHEVEPLPEEIVAQLDAVIAEAEATMEPAPH
jgi:trimethylamine--corrinoid protein Co-methyltransferase